MGLCSELHKNMKLFVCSILLVLFVAVQTAPLEGSDLIEGSELVHGYADSEVYDEFGQEMVPSGDWWIHKAQAKGKKFGDAKYHAGANKYRKGMKWTTMSFGNSIKALKAATKKFREAKARYLLKKGCKRVKQCKTNKCVGKKAKKQKRHLKDLARSGMGPNAHLMGRGGGVRLWSGKSDGLAKMWEKHTRTPAKNRRNRVALVQKQPWIRMLPCQKKVCRWITKCDKKKVKAFERKHKKEEAAAAKKAEAKYMKEVSKKAKKGKKAKKAKKGGKKKAKKGGKKGGKKA